MNIKKIEKQLKKINQLFETIKEDGTVSGIEKDLMLSYVRGLYEKLTEPQDDNLKINNSDKVSKSKEKKESPKIEVIEPKQNNIADVVLQEVVQADYSTANTENSAQPVASYSAPIYQESVVKEVVEAPKNEIPQDLEDLFKSDSVNDLSDKLSRAPVQDLTKCMGINEKIFTVQELFGGDSGLFAKAMESMDKFTSLEQARDYLVEHVAVNQNWVAEGKIKKATNFIKLISRRY
jgi:hypothetical protein